jgi:hypothetical protein
MRAMWLVLFLAISFMHAGMVLGSLGVERGKLTAREDIRRLVKVTLQFFEKGTPPSGSQFWRAIGRAEPLLDPWGAAYLLDHPARHEFRWRSLGPDGKLASPDDIELRIPFGDGLGIDFTHPSLDSETPAATDAI